MKRSFKKLVYRILGQDNYIKILGVIFPIVYRLGLLKSDPIYHFHYFIKNLIKSGDTVIDIGANMGYHTRNFAKLVGRSGKVIAIEPILPFYKQLQRIARKYPQCTIYNYALGSEEKNIQLSIPNDNGYLRTGLASVKNDDHQAKNEFLFEAKMVKASSLLSGLDKIDYIKCDIEGYEEIVIPEIGEVIKKHKPMIQIETSGNQREFILKYLGDLGYTRYSLQKDRLVKNLPLEQHFGDFLFIYE